MIANGLVQRHENKAKSKVQIMCYDGEYTCFNERARV